MGGQTMIASSKAPPDLAGTVLEGNYRLIRLIGRGGMGSVYEAVQLRLHKRVAIKLMAPSEISDQVSLARFHREAEVTSHLGHPHLVNVVDFGTAESGQPYIVMEYLEGEDLDQRLHRCKRLPAETAARIVVQTASALGAAHAQDVVHRDMKPANIFLMRLPGEPEFVKVLDFGISKIKAANSKRLTRDHMVVGTPSYMSPEQATGRANDIDHRTDQWALACIAWEMLCGHPPFVADDVTAVMYQIAKIDPPSLSKEIPGLPPEAEEVLMKALSKRHTARHSSIREFARAFESAVLGYATELTPLPGMRALSDKGELLVRDRIAQGVTPGPVGDASYGEGVAWITEKVTRLRVRRWPILVGVGVVAAILVVVGVLRSHAPVTSKAAPAALAPVATQVQVVPLPDVPSTATATALTDPSASNLPSAVRKRGKSKTGTDLGTDAGKAKKKAAQPKHRLFEKL
jgi:tRNA A-37 threonylcarbamoyl transferase component Bud32